ncbi:MAG: serine/threonine protein phosphatase [Betaproteobacteria bacterium]|nr:MAG: serine/threonine protein phosphatase [Betaproteobacteria bacterium]
MIRLRRACPAGTGRPPRTPPDTVVYAIGDIHGSSALLHQILEDIRFDSRGRAERRRVLVFLGDYVSRGADSRAVVELALDPGLPGFEVVALKGNNEDLLLRFLDGKLSVGAHWLDYGGAETMQHYGLRVVNPRSRDPAELEALRWRSESLPDYGVSATAVQGVDRTFLEDLRQRFAASLPRRHRDFFRSLRVAHREGDYYFVHAGIRPGVPLEAQTDADCMWIRQSFLESDADHGVVVVHGHSIAPAPEVRHNRIGIDTGAYRSGVLTCLVLRGTEHKFLQAGGITGQRG